MWPIYRDDVEDDDFNHPGRGGNAGRKHQERHGGILARHDAAITSFRPDVAGRGIATRPSRDAVLRRAAAMTIRG